MTVLSPTLVVAEKAQALVAENRVFVRADEALVLGASGVYLVVALDAGVRCSCLAGHNLDPVSCSHKVAAQIVWGQA
jgi:hypothetical protein